MTETFLAKRVESLVRAQRRLSGTMDKGGISKLNLDCGSVCLYVLKLVSRPCVIMGLCLHVSSAAGSSGWGINMVALDGFLNLTLA